MIHFPAAAWFEFSRGIRETEQSAAMADHLELCAECRKLLNMWREVSDIGLRELSYYPPLNAIQFAKAAFPSPRNWGLLRNVAESARLLFDSLLEPAPTEVRGSTVSSRQSLHEAAPFMIDLRLECEPARSAVHLNGQVLNSNDPDNDVSNVEVFLVRGDDLAMRTSANTSGEFDLDFTDEEGLRLFVEISGQKVVEVRLPNRLANCDGVGGKVE